MKMKKYILSAFVCSLTACGGGGGSDGHKIYLTPITGQVFQYDFPVEDMADEETYDEFVSLKGYKATLNFATNKNGNLVSIQQVVTNSSGVATTSTWASLDFPLSLFSTNDMGLIQASIVKNFDMQGAEKTFTGTNNASMSLGGAAVGLSYSDFGVLISDVTGEYTGPGGPTPYSWKLSQTFQGGNEANLIAQTDWQAAISPNVPVKFSGLSFATLRGTVGGVSAAPGSGSMIGNASLQLDNDGRIGLELDFSKNGAGIWIFSSPGSGFVTYLNGTKLEEGSPKVEVNVYGKPATETHKADILEAIGTFEHKIDEDNYLGGNFGVKRN